MDNAQLVKRDESKLKAFRSMLEAAAPKLREVAPKYLSAERMIRIACLAVSRTPKLLECTPLSVVNSIMDAAKAGLEIGYGYGAQAHLVPFFNGKTRRMECQMIPDYKGIVALARRNGDVQAVYAEVAREGDELRRPRTIVDEKGARVEFFHEKRAPVTAPVIGAFALISLPNGAYQIAWMEKDELDNVRAVSKAKDSGPWVNWPDEMMKKTVLKRALKTIDTSPEIRDMIEKAEQAEFGTDLLEGAEEPARKAEEGAPARKADALAEKLKEKGESNGIEPAPSDRFGGEMSEEEKAAVAAQEAAEASQETDPAASSA